MIDRADNVRRMIARAKQIDAEDPLTLLVDAACLICAEEDWDLEQVIVHLIATTQIFRETPPEDVTPTPAQIVGRA
jgi:hypothetical protein